MFDIKLNSLFIVMKLEVLKHVVHYQMQLCHEFYFNTVLMSQFL